MEKYLWKFESGSKRKFATFRLIEDSERRVKNGTFITADGYNQIEETKEKFQ
jgi:hypothetical protein